MIPPYIWIPVIAALFFSVGSLFNKQAMAQGCGPLRIYMLQACCGALLLSPFWFHGSTMPISMWWQPLLTGLCWFSGSTLYVHTLRDGDLSIIGPVAGVKPIFNAALIALLLGVHVPLSTWIACGLAALALAVMRTPSSQGSHAFGRTAIQTLAAMLLYAFTDLCIQRWASGWGAFRFGALMYLTGALLTTTLIPRFGKKFRELSSTARRNLFIGAPLAAVPGMLITFSIGTYGHGAEVNVSYSLHVLFTLAIVWLFGRHIGNREHTVGHGVFLKRTAGALILLAAIILIISGRAT